jgi:DNA-binding MarR family transcriptional regulator
MSTTADKTARDGTRSQARALAPGRAAPSTPSQAAKSPPGQRSRALTEDDLLRGAADCVCFNLRRATRVVTQLYDQALRDSGLRATQFSLLAALHIGPALSMNQLAELLGADRTTLTRNLRPLERQGLVASSVGADRRVREVSITEEGRLAFEEAITCWSRAQKLLRERLGEAGVHTLLDELFNVTMAAQR